MLHAKHTVSSFDGQTLSFKTMIVEQFQPPGWSDVLITVTLGG